MKTQQSVKSSKSIANKITSLLIILLIAIFAITGFIINSKISKIVEDMAKNELKKETEKAASDITTYLSEKSQVTNILAQSENIVDYVNAAKGIKDRTKVKKISEYKSVLKTMNTINERDEQISLVYVALPDSSCFISQDKDYIVADDFDLSKRGWYTDAVKKKSTHITSPYLDLVAGGLVISSVSPIYDENGKDIGATAIDVSIDKISEMLDNIKFADGSEKILVDADGSFVYYKDEDKIMNEKIIDQGGLQDVGKSMISGKAGIEILKSKDGDKYMAYSPIKISNWSVGISVPNTYISDRVWGVTLMFIIFYSISCVLIALAIYIIIKQFVSKPINLMLKNIDRISNFDLRNSEDNLLISNSNDELGLMTNSLSKMRDNLIEIVSGINLSAQNTAATAQELTATTQSTNESANDVATAVSDIAMGADSQAEDTTSASKNVESTNVLLKNMMNILSELSLAVNEINSMKNEGKTALDELMTISNDSEREAEYVGKIITETNESAEAISKASEMIQSIADQTNLLALNAAIEAARAGEAGKGFAVVAEEIRKLAEDSSKFTEEIRKIIDELKLKTENAVKAMSTVGIKMLEQGKKVNLTQEKFENIEDAVNKSNGIVEEVNESSKEIEEKNNEIMNLIQKLSEIAEQNASISRDAASAVDVQSSSINDISKASENLAEIATELQEEVSEFKL